VGYAGEQLRSRWHLAAAAGYFLLFIGFFVIGQFNDPAKLGAADAIMTVIILVSRLGGAAHAG
jgi:bacteriorhodopsin